MFILFALLPLAVSAGCDIYKIADCAKCGVGPIGNQFDGRNKGDGKTMDVCNCNGAYGVFPNMCPKTGSPELPTCCNVDGKTVNVQGCKCGTTSCSSDQLCTASTNTCAYPVCINTDGSKVLGDMKGGKCQCGKDDSCVAGQQCNAAAKNTYQTCEYPECKTTDASAATNAKCKCGTYQICDEGDTCTADTTDPNDSGTCKSKSTPAKELPKCKFDVVTTEKCICHEQGTTGIASIGQTCPKGAGGPNGATPFWPVCKGSDSPPLNQQCRCADTNNRCGYGSKCTQSGTYKGRCECVRNMNVGCMEVVQPKGTCPLSCDDHTTMDATPIVFDECLEYGDYYVKYSVVEGSTEREPSIAFPAYYSDNTCKTEAVPPSAPYQIRGGCQTDFKEYLTLPGSPAAANGGTALQITVPALFVVGLLAFVLL